MSIVVFGLGLVGTVTAACLLRQGHVVFGADTNEHRRDLIAQGVSPFHEKAVAEPLAEGRAAGRLHVVKNINEQADADMIIVCVGTPGLEYGALDISHVKEAALSLGEVVRLRPPALQPMLLVFRSTMLPGSMTNIVLPAIGVAAGEAPGSRYEIAYNPEFLRQGSAVEDYLTPARIIIGERGAGTAQSLLDLYQDIEAPIFMTSFEVAELTKYADNTFHALKVAFANEIGRYALRAGIPPSEVFNLFLADTKSNISPRYLQPGAPFGGSCLRKDVLALSVHAREIGITAPIVSHILDSNAAHTDFLIAEIERRTTNPSRLLLIGLSFKPGTDDLRESPLIELAESLLDRGHDLGIYDPDLNWDVAENENKARLPLRLSSIILSRLPPEAVWIS